MSNSGQTSGGIGMLSVLGIVFITLKLLGKISWSWWWVLAPFWGGAVGVITIVLIIFGLFKYLQK